MEGYLGEYLDGYFGEYLGENLGEYLGEYFGEYLGDKLGKYLEGTEPETRKPAASCLFCIQAKREPVTCKSI